MHKTVVSAALAAELEQFDQGTQLCDASGRTFGLFVPYVDPSIYEPAEPELSDEELRRIAQSSEWYSTTDVLKHLEGLR